MLFERWDKGRGIHVPLPIEAHIRPAMMHLAYWIYSDEALQGGVTERKLIWKAADYLCLRRFEDRDEAEQAAREFIQFCRGRAWVFTDMGTTKVGESLYQFTHRTFLEYFTAAYLVRTYPTSEKLVEVLLPKIAKQEWDVIAQLAFQLQNKNIEGAGDELLSALIDKAAQTQADERWNLLSFAAQCLEFIVPSPRVTRNITRAYVEYGLARKIDEIELENNFEIEFGEHWEEFEIEELFYILFMAATENVFTITDTLLKLLINRINSESKQKSLIALEIVIALNLADDYWDSCWINLSQEILHICINQIEILCQDYLQLCLYAYFLQRVSIANLIKWHGIQSIFVACLLGFSSRWFPFPAESLISDVLVSPYFSNSSKQLEKNLYELKEVGRVFLSYPLPLPVQQLDLDLGWTMLSSTLKEIESERLREPLALDSEAFFGAFTLLAAMLEVGKGKESIEACEHIRESQNPFFNSICWTFLARFELAKRDKVQAELEHCGFTPEQQAFAWGWVRREINFVTQVAG